MLVYPEANAILTVRDDSNLSVNHSTNQFGSVIRSHLYLPMLQSSTSSNSACCLRLRLRDCSAVGKLLSIRQIETHKWR